MSLLSDIGTAIKNKLGGTSVDNTVPRYDGTTCKLQGSGVTISDTNAVTASGGFIGNASTATKLNNSSTDWSGSGAIGSVVGMLSWKNYGNGHVIFDASNGTAPNGAAVNNTNAQTAWSPSYPTLMGWNGSSTYGVRVDSARVADYASNSIGYNQTWQNVTTSRALGTTYTNTTGKPIMVKVKSTNANSTEVTFTVNGVVLPRWVVNTPAAAYANDCIIVPNGQTYSVAMSPALTDWFELR